jgi:putative nucleotidyltransferase with HDIG domain
MTTAYQVINGLNNVIGQLVSAISRDTTGLVQINDLKSYDEYTYHHSLSVAILSIATGQALKLSTPKLFSLGRCAIMHDIGKQLTPIEIINKKGKLTQEEFLIVKKHAAEGAMSIKNKGIGDMELWSGIMFHHEKIDGTGYPKQLTGKEIPLFSRIIAVADVYDAVTSYRSYRTPMSPADAYEYIMSETGTAFEHDIVIAFAKKLQLYPVNTVVELSDKRKGVVVENNNLSLRPMVRVLPSNELLDLSVSKNLNIIITKTFTPCDFIHGEAVKAKSGEI